MAVLLLALSTACFGSAPDASRLRTDDPELRALMAHGLMRSPTLRLLVAALDQTDVVVYVQPALIRRGLGGYVPHLVVANDNVRYVFAVVAPDMSRNARIGVIAHELQHVVEIARAPDVGRTQPVADLFARIGFRNRDASNAYETIDALATERAVRAELLDERPASCADK